MPLFSIQNRLDGRYRIDSRPARFHLAGQRQKVKPRFSSRYKPIKSGVSQSLAVKRSLAVNADRPSDDLSRIFSRQRQVSRLRLGDSLSAI